MCYIYKKAQINITSQPNYTAILIPTMEENMIISTLDGYGQRLIVCPESVELIKQHIDEIGITYPLDDDGAYAILKYFETMDADIGGWLHEGKHVDPELIRKIN